MAATSSVDYTVETATLTIAARESTGTTSLTFTAVDDNLAEPDETVKVEGTIAGEAQAGLSATPARLTIQDDDEEPSSIVLSASPNEVTENDGVTSINVTATLSGGGARTADTAVTLSVHDVSAEAGQDYSTGDMDTVLSIPAGQMSVTGPLPLTLLDDDFYEGTEQIAIRGTNEAPGLAVGGLRISINDDDTEPSQVSLTLDKDTISEDGGSQQVGVTATILGTARRSVPTQVSLSLEEGTAEYSDYTAFASMVNIPAGEFEGRASVIVQPNDDSIDEQDETLEVQGTTPIAGLSVETVLLTISDNDEAGVTVTPTALTIDEGESDTYRVTLNTQPTGDVTVTVVDPADNTDVTASPDSLTFTTSNWNQSQTVTVSSAEDPDILDENAVVTHTVSGGGYDSVTVPGVEISVDDGEIVSVVLSETALTVEEGDSTGETYTVRLSHQPSEEVSVAISGHAGTDLTLTGLSGTNTLTFTTSNWDTAQTVTVKAGEDSDGAVTTLPVTVDDDETVSILLSETALTVTEGDAAGSTYTVELSHQPSATVSVTVSGQAGTDLTLTGLSGTNTLTFTTSNWDTAQTVTVKAGEDSDGADESATLTHTATGGEYAGITRSLPVTVDDDETVSVLLSETSLTVDEGDSTGETYTVSLSHQPSVDVTVTVSGQAGTDLTLTGLSGTNALTFTTSNWNTAQTVTVKAGEDSDGADDSETLTHTAVGGEYAEETADLTVTVDDDETVSVVLSKASLTVDEGDSTGETYTVRLSHQPSETVTVTVSGQAVPRQLLLPDSRRLVLPVHLLCLAPLLGCISPVAGDVKLEDDGVVHHPVDGRGGGHGVGKDALPLGEDQV